ncbi:MAG: 7-cyano-7-deazaguanine synthase QueC [Deltaproteobacteria bacterium]|nr:7-cyano-7-deazaguanine synthase QueC [Deltaproteobacteria bacterium]
MTNNKKAVVLLSGGIDSTTVMAIAINQGFQIFSLSFFYGQRHAIELECANKIAKIFGAKRHLVLNVDLKPIGGSALTDDIEVPKINDLQKSGNVIPVTYVPARNTIFLSYALAWAEVIGAFNIFIGVNAVDYSGYPDCRPEFISAFEKMANLATKAGVEQTSNIKIQTPLLHKTKADIIQTGIKLGVDYAITHSCYDPSLDGKACGFCDSCILRKKGFKDAGVVDPTPYVS